MYVDVIMSFFAVYELVFNVWLGYLKHDRFLLLRKYGQCLLYKWICWIAFLSSFFYSMENVNEKLYSIAFHIIAHINKKCWKKNTVKNLTCIFHDKPKKPVFTFLCYIDITTKYFMPSDISLWTPSLWMQTTTIAQ